MSDEADWKAPRHRRHELKGIRGKRVGNSTSTSASRAVSLSTSVIFQRCSTMSRRARAPSDEIGMLRSKRTAPHSAVDTVEDAWRVEQKYPVAMAGAAISFIGAICCVRVFSPPSWGNRCLLGVVAIASVFMLVTWWW
jgi:hypothetical protein